MPELSILIQGPRFQKLGNRINQPGSTDSLGLGTTYRYQHRFIRGRIDPHLFNGPTRRTHSKLDAPTFKGRTRGTGGAHQPVLVPKDDLTVGPNVHEEGEILPLENSRSQHTRDDVPPDVAGHHGEDIDMNVFVQLNSRIDGTHGWQKVGRWNIRVFSQVFGIQSQKELRHSSIARDDHV